MYTYPTIKRMEGRDTGKKGINRLPQKMKSGVKI